MALIIIILFKNFKNHDIMIRVPSKVYIFFYFILFNYQGRWHLIDEVNIQVYSYWECEVMACENDGREGSILCQSVPVLVHFFHVCFHHRYNQIFTSVEQSTKQNTPICSKKIIKALKEALMIEDILYYGIMRSHLLQLKLWCHQDNLYPITRKRQS